ncbi:hypothetical protein SASPL_102387 [Salvia splendens]|uniref:Retrovirus-related Pol polyprotein from transposon TNT 1-94-like beta-barrel domain-containing protein n=1 Tax=Salvia splendens TaxID=180675 RepID=A0A8X8YTM2_SALSN|nr:hypothetical protein SASPL_102387 [Salvia splendens]
MEDDEEWTTLDEKAHSTIMLCLSDDVIIEVAEQETAVAHWTKLESLYMTKSLTNKLLLKQRLFRLRMQEGMPLQDHLENLNKILLDLRNVDVKVKDEDVALILLVSLPESYENFVESFMTGKETLSLEDVRSALHIREDRQQATSTATENLASGLSVTGHWKIDCPQIKKKLGKKKDANDFATVAEADDANSEEELTLVADEQPHCNDVWILDSGASHHLCPHREYFTTYEQIDGGNVTMANSAVCKFQRWEWSYAYSERFEGGSDSSETSDVEDLEGVDKQVELQVTHDESESQLQGGEDQHTTTEATTDTTSSDVHPEAH